MEEDIFTHWEGHDFKPIEGRNWWAVSLLSFMFWNPRRSKRAQSSGYRVLPFPVKLDTKPSYNTEGCWHVGLSWIITDRPLAVELNPSVFCRLIIVSRPRVADNLFPMFSTDEPCNALTLPLRPRKAATHSITGEKMFSYDHVYAEW